MTVPFSQPIRHRMDQHPPLQATSLITEHTSFEARRGFDNVSSEANFKPSNNNLSSWLCWKKLTSILRPQRLQLHAMVLCALTVTLTSVQYSMKLTIEEKGLPDSTLHRQSRVLIHARPIRMGSGPVIAKQQTHQYLPTTQEKFLSELDYPRMDLSTLSETQISAAKNFVFQRRAQYADFYKEGNDKHWSIRGLGWLYVQQGLVLTASIPDSPVITLGRQVITIRNVGDRAHRKDCHLLTLWVRVSGPEIFAGAAKPVNSTLGDSLSCYWEFAFGIHMPGKYQVDAKVLLWDGYAVVNPQDCQTVIDQPQHVGEIVLKYPHRESVTGFKFYTPILSCCEICTRLPRCVYWSYPSLSNMDPGAKGCELYFHDVNEHLNRTVLSLPGRELMVQATSRALLSDPSFAYGLPRDHANSYFLGCGWSFWLSMEYPCLSNEFDDQIHMMKREFVLSPMTERHVVTVSDVELPLCTLPHEEQAFLGFTNSQAVGRWVREAWPDHATCPLPFQVDANYSTLFPIHEHDGEHPQCWHRDNFTLIGTQCIEKDCIKIVEQAWKSHLRLESNWFGTWRPNECQYQELTDEDLQSCVNRRGIRSIMTQGKSVAKFLDQYLQQRLQRIVLTGATHSMTMVDAGVNIVLHTFAFPHMMWRQSPEEWVHELERQVARQEEEFDATKNNRSTEHYWVTGFYYSSEREPLVHVGRSEQLTRVAANFFSSQQQHQQSRQYRMLSALDLTAAFTYDTATQQDGLHIIGPPMKMIITKLLHYMCTT